MRKRVVITGLGSINPLGNDIASMWNNLITGQSGVGPITTFDPSWIETKFAAEVKGFDGPAFFGKREARRMDRFTQLALAAAIQAINDSQLVVNDDNKDQIGVVIGSGIGGIGSFIEQMKVMDERGPTRISPFTVPMMLVDTAPGTVAIYLGVRGPNLGIVTACASGTNAVGEAAEVIRRGDAEVMLAGGSEAAINPICIAGLNVMNALSTRNDEPECASRPFDRTRDGFVMGEGAAVLILESLEHAQQRGSHILAEISGYGATNDAYHISAPAENGIGAVICMQLALKDAGIQPADINYINAHGTSTPLNDKTETTAIKAVFGELAYKTPISSVKSMTGHLMGASGALEAAICVKVLEQGIIPPTINYQYADPECDLDYVPNIARRMNVRHIMSNSFGFGGHNAVIILSQYIQSEPNLAM